MNGLEYFRNHLKWQKKLNVAPIVAPRSCSRQVHRSNTPSATTEEYFSRNIYLPFLDNLIQQFSIRFGDLEKQAVRALNLIPSNVADIETETAEAILNYYRDDLPSPDSFQQELKLWQHMWGNVAVGARPNTLSDTLADSKSCRIMYPNVTKIIHLFLLTSVTSCTVERANSSLRFVKSCFGVQ